MESLVLTFFGAVLGFLVYRAQLSQKRLTALENKKERVDPLHELELKVKTHRNNIAEYFCQTDATELSGYNIEGLSELGVILLERGLERWGLKIVERDYCDLKVRLISKVSETTDEQVK